MSLDYADWLTPERLGVEERQWALTKMYVRYANAIRRLVAEHSEIRTVLEFGAGTGWVPTELDDLRLEKYVCVDRNPGCIARATIKNANRHSWVRIVNQEIRDLKPQWDYDLVCGFAVLKHFRLDEWQGLFAQLFSAVPYGLFSMPVARQLTDDGLEHTHVLVTEEFLAQAIRRAGHHELWRITDEVKEPIFAIGKGH